MDRTERSSNDRGQSEVIALGWYVVFGHVSRMEEMRLYYERVLDLPLYLNWRRAAGRVEDKDHFWAGEAVIFDINYGGTELPVGPRQAAVFRVHGLDDLVSRIRERGGDVGAPEEGPYGRTAAIVDPMRQLVLLREVRPDSTLPADAEARRRRARGEAFNPGCAPLPAGWQELGWVQLRAADPERLARFYSDALGLAEIDRRDGAILLDLGDQIGLEIVPGGVPRPAPPAQMASTATFILRTRKLRHLVGSLAARGVETVGTPYVSPRGEWLYVADPEGNVVGLAEWVHPAAYRDVLPVMPEDIEAARRAAEARA